MARIVPLAETAPRDRRVAVGTFDGVHLGHKAVIDAMDTVLTFDPHPIAVIHPEAVPKLLTPLETKAELVGDLGVQELVVIPFDQQFAHQSAQEFIDHVLVERLNATYVSVGENFRFGHRATGTPDLLRAQESFDTRVVPLVEQSGEMVSSSHIRGLVAAGEVDEAALFLGAPFRFRGEVVPGDRRGRELGYPTANLVPDDSLACPGHGIYACWARVGDEPETYAAAVNVGVRPTFQTGRGLLVEAYLLDFDRDIYGAELKLEFIERLRGEKAFSTVEALVEQMGRDVERARALLLPSPPA